MNTVEINDIFAVLTYNRFKHKLILTDCIPCASTWSPMYIIELRITNNTMLDAAQILLQFVTFSRDPCRVIVTIPITESSTDISTLTNIVAHNSGNQVKMLWEKLSSTAKQVTSCSITASTPLNAEKLACIICMTDIIVNIVVIYLFLRETTQIVGNVSLT